MIKQSRLYQEAFAKHGDSPAAVLWPRGRQQLRFEALTQHIKGAGFSVLDFGCGLAHLKDYLDMRYTDYSYIGADVVPEFIQSIRDKHSNAVAHQISDHTELVQSVDHVVISGTFNIIDGSSAKEYLTYVKSVLEYLYGICKVSLSVNFMTDKVDFMQPGAHHVNVNDMYNFMSERLSPRLKIDQSYMPYEFTVVAYRKDEIIRPDNIYEKC